MTITWDEEKMTTGFPEIDEQHKEWIHHLNEFNGALNEQKDPDIIQRMLDFLTQYTEYHFKSEEAMMDQFNLPVAETNHQAHETFRGKLAEIRAWVKQEGVSPVEVLALDDMLNQWLVNHICTIDVSLRAAAANYPPRA